MEDFGIIKEISNNKVKIQLFGEGINECNKCNLSNICFNYKNNERLLVIDYNNKSIKEGDSVIVKINEFWVIFITFLVFIVPILIFIISFIIIGNRIKEIYKIFLGLGLIFLYFLFIKFFEKGLLSKVKLYKINREED